MDVILIDWLYRFGKMRRHLLMKVVWALPHKIVYWCVIRAGAHATTGAYSNTVVPELTLMDALERWDDPTGGDRVYGGAA